MTRAEAIAEAIRQGANERDAQAIGSSLPEDCSFRTPGFSGPAIIVNRCGMLAKAREHVERAREELTEARGPSSYASAGYVRGCEEELADCLARLEDMLRDYGLADER